MRVLPILLAAAWLSACATVAQPRLDVDATLDALHERASKADLDGYLALFSDDAVFLGTDRDEIWPIDVFSAYVAERFATGTGWTYVPTERTVHRRGDVAWFEERVLNAAYGETRGTGVLVLDNGVWRIAQYNLTLPIPNDLFDDVSERIKEFYQE